MAKICLIVGNGFTISMVRQLGLENQISLSKLLPPQDHVRLLNIQSGTLESSQYLWSPDLFPQLWEQWHAQGFDKLDAEKFYEFCELQSVIHEHQRPPFASDGSFNLSPATKGYELTSYLWYLFYYYDLFIVRHLQNSMVAKILIREWETVAVLESILDLHDLIAISYNYDCCLENILAGCFSKERGSKPLVKVATNNARQEIQNAKLGSVIVVKPHGSIALQAPQACYRGETPWVNTNWLFSGLRFDQNYSYEYPIRRFPLWPDLVPPGHMGPGYRNPKDDSFEAACDAVEACDCLVIYGISARPPDHAEFAKLFYRAMGKTIIHVDPCEDTNASRILKSMWKKRYHWIHPDELLKIPELINSK